MGIINRYLSDFLTLFFPEICYACGDSLVQSESLICATCLHQLPFTNYHLEPDNKLAKQFWGRVNIKSATAFLYFNKGGKVQNLMHQLKYNNQPQIGILLGNLYAKHLIASHKFENINAIIPVPLHPKKQKKRGYNQSEKFGIGLSKSLGIKLENLLVREKFTDTQTKKSRLQRLDNVEEVFAIRKGEEISGLRILLVDDVITTGATLCACSNVLLAYGAKTVDLATIAAGG